MLFQTSFLCVCPIGAALTAIPTAACREDIGQVQKILFQRKFSTGTTLNGFVIATDDPSLLASWTTVTGAADGTKVVVSPFLSNPETDGGAPITFGGGNASIGGIAEIVNREPVNFTCQLYYQAQNVVKVIKELQCEVLAGYLVDQYGRISGIADDNDTPTIFRPIPFRGFFVGDKLLGGLEAPDSNAMQWSYEPNYSDEFYIVTPTDFNPLTDL